MLRLVESRKKQIKNQLKDIYCRMADNALAKIQSQMQEDNVDLQTVDRFNLMQFVYCQLKYIQLLFYHNEKYWGYKEYQKFFSILQGYLNIMEYLTPLELMQTFPIDKDFYGHTYGAKDYFYTKEIIDKLDMNRAFFEQNIRMVEFLWDYRNNVLDSFYTDIIMYTVDKLCRFQGKPDFFDRFYESFSSNDTKTSAKKKSPHLTLIKK